MRFSLLKWVPGRISQSTTDDRGPKACGTSKPVESGTDDGMASGRLSERTIQLVRLSIFALVVLCIHLQHGHWQRQQRARNVSAELKAIARRTIPETSELVAPESPSGLITIVDAEGQRAGYLVRTSPSADHIIGFSGPTDIVMVASGDREVLSVEILSSRDTREHVGQIRSDPQFLNQMQSHSLDDAQAWTQIDAVSGATLTSYAILESIRYRLALAAGETPQQDLSLRFPNPIPMSAARQLFPDAAEVLSPEESESTWTVNSEDGQVLGGILRTSPVADNITGYQGPTETLIGLAQDDTVTGVVVGDSYDNEPYVDYVRDDDYFLNLFSNRSLNSLASVDLDTEGIEGVSGATMTSLAVTEGIVAAARAEMTRREEARRPDPSTTPAGTSILTLRNTSTILILVMGTIIGLTRLRRRRSIRITSQIVVIAWLGLMNGDLVSMALLMGWAQSGIAWQHATGLSVLCLAALLIPITTGRNVYCAHICPHGAVQQLIRNRLPWRLRLSRRTQSWLSVIPAVLIAWVALIGLLHLPFSPVDIEPFDAWLWTVAGTATLSIAAISLAASAIVPLAYCRFGCPTGAVLNFLRRPRTYGFTAADYFAVGLLMAAVAVVLLG